MSINQKFDGNVTVTGNLLKGDGTSFGVKKTLLGYATNNNDVNLSTMEWRIKVGNGAQLNWEDYDLFIFTGGGNLIIYLSSQLLNSDATTDTRIKQSGMFIVKSDGTTNICKSTLHQFLDEDGYYKMSIIAYPQIDPTAEYVGYLFGLKFS